MEAFLKAASAFKFLLSCYCSCILKAFANIVINPKMHQDMIEILGLGTRRM